MKSVKYGPLRFKSVTNSWLNRAKAEPWFKCLVAVLSQLWLEMRQTKWHWDRCLSPVSIIAHSSVIFASLNNTQHAAKSLFRTELGMTLHVLYGTRRFITVYTKAATYPLSWASLIKLPFGDKKLLTINKQQAEWPLTIRCSRLFVFIRINFPIWRPSPPSGTRGDKISTCEAGCTPTRSHRPRCLGQHTHKNVRIAK